MSIDERLEALARSIELLDSMHRETVRVHQETQRFVSQCLSELAESLKRLPDIGQ